MRSNVNTFNYRDIVPNANFNEYIAKQNEVVEKYSKSGHRISKTDDTSTISAATPSNRRSSVKSEVSSSSHTASIKRHSTASLTSGGSSSRHSMHSVSSTGSLRRSPVKVVIPPTPEKVSHSVDNKSSDGLSQTSDDAIMIVAPGPMDTAYNTNTQVSKEMDVRNQENMGKRQETRQEVTRKGSAGYTIDDIPPCGIPSLPVTTKITKLITDQQEVVGTLRQSTRKMKKSASRGEEIDISDLPPPPPDPVILNIEDLPPPPDDMLPPPPPSPPQELAAEMHEQRARASFSHMSVTSPSPQQALTMSYGGNVFASGPVEGVSNISSPINRNHPAYATLPRSAPATPKKVPPPPPVKSNGFGTHSRSQHHGFGLSHPSAAGTTVTPAQHPIPQYQGYTGGSSMKGSKTTYFISDLQRVLNEKHTRSTQLRDDSPLPPPPPEPMTRPFLPEPEPSFEDLPPPPAELLQGLKQMKKKKPPPPPKRKDVSY